MQHQSSARPGGTVTYSVWIWSTVGASRVTANVTASGQLTRAPRYTLCPVIFGTRCSIGSLPANQAFELIVSDQVKGAAHVGDQITLTVGVQGAGLSPAFATITTVISAASPSPSPSTTPPFTPPPPTTFPQVPFTTVSPGSLSNLFPVVTPTASPTRAGGQSRHGGRQLLRLTSSSLPLDSRLIGGQLAALAVLAAAVTMVVARLSLRSPQPAAPAPGAATTAEADEAVAEKPAS